MQAPATTRAVLFRPVPRNGNSDATEPRARANVLLKKLADTDITGVVVGDPWVLSSLPVLASVSAHNGLSVTGVAGPLADDVLPANRRLPHLYAVDDREERIAATRLCERNLSALSALGAQLLILNPVDTHLAQPEAALRSGFSRRELDAGSPGLRCFEAARAERQSYSNRFLDAACKSLDRLAHPTERSGVVLTLRPAASLWGFPSPREALLLVAKFAGAPLRIAYDSGAWDILTTLGLTAGAERQAQLIANAGVYLVSDTVGLDAGIPPGLGESSFTWLRAVATPAAGTATRTTPLVLDVRADTTQAELIGACKVLAHA